jgi:electron transfer flavoprotein alpha/beta subunit
MHVRFSKKNDMQKKEVGQSEHYCMRKTSTGYGSPDQSQSDGSGIEDGQIKWVMNPYDEYGVEEALRLKEKNGGDVTIVSVGPARAMETIRTALAMGADKGIHICDPALDNADAFVTASALAAAIKGLPYDIIFLRTARH